MVRDARGDGIQANQTAHSDRQRYERHSRLSAGVAAGQEQQTRCSSLPSAETGEVLFQLKGCAGCHTGAHTLAKRVAFRTVSDFSAAMWNHSSMMKQSGELRPEEMKRLVGYVWSLQFAADTGDSARGAKVFAAKACGSCHTNGPGPKICRHGPRRLYAHRVAHPARSSHAAEDAVVEAGLACHQGWRDGRPARLPESGQVGSTGQCHPPKKFARCKAAPRRPSVFALCLPAVFEPAPADVVRARRECSLSETL